VSTHRRLDAGAASAGRACTPRAPRSADRPAEETIWTLQRLVGNRAVARALDAEYSEALEPEMEQSVLVEELVPDDEGAAPDTAPPAAGFEAAGMTGTTPFGDPVDPRHLRCAHAFINGGQTGTIAWSGGAGAGAHANEGSGSIQTQLPPTFVSSAGPAAGKFSSAITAGTGVVSVTRSFLGAFSGSQGGNGWFLTAQAAARINQHEVRHVNSTRGIYNTTLKPMEGRIANAALGKNVGATGPAATAAHAAVIRWAPTITSFQTADVTANQPGGTTDTTDTGGAGSWIVDNGPGTVAGTAYTHIVTKAGEAMPAP
jgi:hypothetical protein